MLLKEVMMKNCSEKITTMSEYMDAVLTQFRKYDM